MSYSKLPKVVADYAVGMQSVNQALDNNRALFDQFDAKHSVGRAANIADIFINPGQHNDTLIARTAADFIVDAGGLAVVSYSMLFGPILNDAPKFVETGRWKVYVTSPRLIGAVATVKAASAADYYAQCRLSSDGDGTFIMVTTWDVSAGALVNVSFSLVVWSDGVS